MSDRLPEFIDPFRLAEQHRVLRGRLMLERMRRLAPLLASTEGWVDVDLSFDVDDLGVRYVSGRISGELAVLCQRCMEPMVLPVSLSPALGMARSDGEAERLPSHYDPLIVSSDPMPLAAIVEDELMLALPIVPTHPPEVCPAAPLVAAVHGHGPAEPSSPFAALGVLKGRGS